MARMLYMKERAIFHLLFLHLILRNLYHSFYVLLVSRRISATCRKRTTHVPENTAKRSTGTRAIGGWRSQARSGIRSPTLVSYQQGSRHPLNCIRHTTDHIRPAGVVGSLQPRQSNRCRDHSRTARESGSLAACLHAGGQLPRLYAIPAHSCSAGNPHFLACRPAPGSCVHRRAFAGQPGRQFIGEVPGGPSQTQWASDRYLLALLGKQFSKWSCHGLPCVLGPAFLFQHHPL